MKPPPLSHFRLFSVSGSFDLFLRRFSAVFLTRSFLFSLFLSIFLHLPTLRSSSYTYLMKLSLVLEPVSVYKYPEIAQKSPLCFRFFAKPAHRRTSFLSVFFYYI